MIEIVLTVSASLLEALSAQKRVISALIFRELKTRFGNTRLGAIWVIAEPALHLAVLMLVWYMIGRMTSSSINPQLFLLTGILPFLFFRTSITRIMKSVDANRTLLIFSEIKIFDLILVRWLMEIFIYFGVMALFIFLFYITGYIEISIEDPYRLIIAASLLCFSALGGGIFFMMLNAILPITEKVLTIVMRLLYFVSGVFFTYNKVPYEYQKYFIYNPVFQMISMIRDAFFIEIPFEPHIMNYHYVFIFFGSLFIVGLYMMHKYRRRLLQEND